MSSSNWQSKSKHHFYSEHIAFHEVRLYDTYHMMQGHRNPLLNNHNVHFGGFVLGSFEKCLQRLKNASGRIDDKTMMMSHLPDECLRHHSACPTASTLWHLTNSQNCDLPLDIVSPTTCCPTFACKHAPNKG